MIYIFTVRGSAGGFFLMLLFFAGSAMFYSHRAFGQYCSPTYLPTGVWAGQPACGSNWTFPGGHAITNVTIGTINNTVALVNCTNSNFTALSTTVVAAGRCQPTPLQVTATGFCGVSVAVDLNNDLDFLDPGEIVVPQQYVAASPALYSLSLAIPIGTLPGLHRMRIFNSGVNAGPSLDPCGVYQFGNFQDYTLNIIADPNPLVLTGFESVSICANDLPYLWNGKVVNAGGTAVDSFKMTNSNDCDSITYLNLTVNPVVTVTEDRTICLKELPYLWNGINVQAGGPSAATFVTSSAAGCDSTTILDLTVHPEVTVREERSICAKDLPYSWNGFTLTAGGQSAATHTIPSSTTGCDSTTILDLTVNNAADVVVDTVICFNDYYYFNGQNHRTKQKLHHVFQTIGGCDSNVTVNLDIKSCCDKTILTPNSFTPNMDGLNDLWTVLVAKESKVTQISIWNRWGQLVYKSINTPWDGKIDGARAEYGTYFFEVNGTCKDGTALYKKGDLVLIR